MITYESSQLSETIAELTDVTLGVRKSQPIPSSKADISASLGSCGWRDIGDYLETAKVLKVAYILSILVFVGQLTFGQDSVKRIIHKPEFLLETDNYTIYKTDTFNVRDGNKKIQGKGILIIKDSIVQYGVASYSLGYHNGSNVATCVYNEGPTNVYYKIREIFYGQFHDNLMTGVWNCFYSNGKKRVELTYNKGVIQGQVNIYFDTGELMYSGTAFAGQDKIELKKYTKSGLQPETIKWWIWDIAELYY